MFILPLVNAVDIENGTILQATVSDYNFTIQQNLSLDQLTITNTTIEFYNVSNTGIIRNTNSTGRGRLDYYGLNNALIWNSNGSVCGNLNVNSNDLNVNCTIVVNNNSIPLDNFNLTEGQLRENSPLWISGIVISFPNNKETKTYSLASNLTDSLNNLDFIANTRCPASTDKIEFLAETGVSNTPIYTCLDANTVQFTLNQYDPATSSNRLIITYLNSQQGAGGGGSSSSIGDPLQPTDLFLCNETYKYIQQYSTITDKISESIDSIKSNYNKTYDYLKFQRYISNWQPYCSDALKRTLEEPYVCDKLYYFLIDKGQNYNQIDFKNFKLKLEDKIVISEPLLKNYADNFNDRCSIIGKSLQIKKNGFPLPTLKFLNLTSCSPELGSALFDATIPLFSIKKEKLSCSSIDILRWFFGLKKEGDVYIFTGLKLWVIIFLSLIFIALMFLGSTLSFNSMIRKIIMMGYLRKKI